jgi:ATP:ADP antiporter, AAA family
VTHGSPLDRALRLFGDVRPGEGLGVVLLFVNVFVLLVAYYLLKTVREPLILSQGGAELRSYAGAAQAALLLFYVPLYSWVASTLRPPTLIVTIVLFFAACIELFVLAGRSGVPYLGFAFFVWLGIFSLTTIAQFWSFANDLYRREDGERLFPLIAIGATVGAPIGAAFAERLFAYGADIFTLMQAAAVLLVVQLGLYQVMQRRRTPAPALVRDQPRRQTGGGFGLVLRSRYLMLIALLLVVLNVVTTTGDYVMTRNVVHAADLASSAPGFDRDAFIGRFYGSYLFWVSIAAAVIQAFVVSRLVKRFGLAGVLFIHPLVALGAYGTVAAGAGLSIARWSKTADSSMDFSATNTAKQMLWLPTSREEKYQAKQAVDTFFVRFGDMIAAGVVFVGTQWLFFGTTAFAISNMLFIGVWLLIATLLLREYRRLSAPRETARAA